MKTLLAILRLAVGCAGAYAGGMAYVLVGASLHPWLPLWSAGDISLGSGVSLPIIAVGWLLSTLVGVVLALIGWRRLIERLTRLRTSA